MASKPSHPVPKGGTFQGHQRENHMGQNFFPKMGSISNGTSRRYGSGNGRLIVTRWRWEEPVMYMLWTPSHPVPKHGTLRGHQRENNMWQNFFLKNGFNFIRNQSSLRQLQEWCMIVDHKVKVRGACHVAWADCSRTELTCIQYCKV